jgi:ceramide glucosyltransferase
MSVVTLILLGCASAALVLFGLGVIFTIWHTRLPSPEPPAGEWPALSLLKPLKGSEEELEANLESFYVQDYAGALEVVFATTEEDDDALPVARRVAARHPDVPTRFVHSDEHFGLNPKVANLAGAMAAAAHDLVLQSDANVRVQPDYVRKVVGEYRARGSALLTSMVVGVGERSAGAAMENLQLSAFIGPAMCTALHLARISCVVGKSMLLSRSELDSLGGLEQVRDILAEDFVLGQRYQQEGKVVTLSIHTVENVNREIGLGQFLGRHSRWLKMRAVIHVGGFVGDLLANPVALTLAAFVASGFEAWIGLILLGVVLVKMSGDAFLMRRTRGVGMRLRHLAMGPLKDSLMGLVWVYSIFSRSVCWRGKKLRFGSMSRLRADDGALPVRVARRLRRA